MLWVRIAIRELLTNRSFSIFFILNLSIGLVGFIALNSFNNSLQAYFKNNLKEILTADLIISSPKPFNDAENSIIESVLSNDKLIARRDIKESRQISFFSMISSVDSSKLANIIAVDKSFPLYGSIISEMKIVGKSTNSNNEKKEYKVSSASLNQGIPTAWISGDIAISMGIKVWDTVKIGDNEFVVHDIVTPPPDASVSSIELAPKIYIGISEVQGTGLLKFGSRITFRRFYKFPPKSEIKSKTIALRDKIGEISDGSPIISVYDSENVNQNLNRIFGYFTGYMGLIGVVALFLAGIGTAYLFRGYLNTKIKEIAILMTLGAVRTNAYQMFIFQVIILGVLSTIFSVVLSFIILPLFPSVLHGLIPPNFRASADFYSVLTAFIPGIFGSIIFCLPVFVRIYDLKPIILLRGVQNLNIDQNSKHSSFYFLSKFLGGSVISNRFIDIIFRKLYIKNIGRILSFLPALITFWILAVSQTHSLRRGSIFFIGSMCVMAVMTLIGWLNIRLLKRFSFTNQFIRKIAFRNIYRNQISSISCFVTIAMGAFLINVIPQIKNGIQDEISQPQDMKIPGFFLIDIQPEQLEPLTLFLKSKNYNLTNASPIVRGRILKVNQKGFYERLGEKMDEKMDEKKRDSSSLRGLYRRREFNFSYRESLDLSEKIVKGKPLSSSSWNLGANNSLINSKKALGTIQTQSQSTKKTPKFMEISLEEGFADRFNLKIGDIMTFDIQGLAFEGEVVNLRKVKWNSFQPNFFILFQRGVLDDAPKTYLASIPQIEPVEKQKLQNSLVKEFPNISVLDVNQTVKQILNITDRLTFAINFMAILAILAGIVVLFSIARHETYGRSWEINLLKVLGAGFSDIRKIIVLEFGFLGFIASFFATILSLIVSYGIAWFFFERLWSFRWEYSLFCLIAITTVCIIASIAATDRIVRQKSSGLLSA